MVVLTADFLENQNHQLLKSVHYLELMILDNLTSAITKYHIKGTDLRKCNNISPGTVIIAAVCYDNNKTKKLDKDNQNIMKFPPRCEML